MCRHGLGGIAGGLLLLTFPPVVSLASGQAAAPPWPVLTKQAVESLVGESFGVYPEVAAWCLQRVAAKCTMPRASRSALIARIFDLGSAVHHPVRLRLISGANTDRPEGFLGVAMTEGLDSLSLKLYAIDETIKQEPEKARAWFVSLPIESIPGSACSNRAIPDLMPFHATAATVIGSYTKTEMAKGLHLEALRRSFANLPSGALLPGAIHLLGTVQWAEEDRAAVISMLSESILNSRAEDRVLREVWPSIAKRLSELAGRLRADGASPIPLLDAFRRHVTKALGAQRCADNIRDDASKPAIGGGSAPRADPPELAALNQLLRQYSLSPVQGAEIEKFETASAGPSDLYWSTGKTRGLERRLREVYHSRAGFSDESTQTRAAQAIRAKTLIDDLIDWNRSSEERDFDFIAQKGHLLSRLLSALPPENDLRDAVVSNLLKTLRLADHAPGARILWVWHVREALLSAKGSGERQTRMLAELSAHDDPNLRFFKRVVELTGPL